MDVVLEARSVASTHNGGQHEVTYLVTKSGKHVIVNQQHRYGRYGLDADSTEVHIFDSKEEILKAFEEPHQADRYIKVFSSQIRFTGV